jgi:hypothetical protein
MAQEIHPNDWKLNISKQEVLCKSYALIDGPSSGFAARPTRARLDRTGELKKRKAGC